MNSPQMFATTHWSVVLSAGATHSAQALETLCRTYWYPLYAYLRRRGHTEPDAQDLVQGFLAHLLERRALERVSPAKGKFRTFLLAALNYYVADDRDRASAQRRGGGKLMLSIDAVEAEKRYQFEPPDPDSPDHIYERRWAMALLDKTLARLESEFMAADKQRTFERLRGFLVEGAGTGTIVEAAQDLGQSVEATKKMVQRLRHRYHALFREEIANTVSSPAEVDEELRHLCQVMARQS